MALYSEMKFTPPDVAPSTFAGFTYPRAVPMLPRGSLATRITQRRLPPVCGPYYWIAPRMAGEGVGFYLDDQGAPGLRISAAHSINRRIGHTGWFCDRWGDQTIYGIVARLPHGRGFLAGWTMGRGMASALDTDRVIEDEADAARAADSLAQRAAEAQWEAEEKDRAEQDEEG